MKTLIRIFVVLFSIPVGAQTVAPNAKPPAPTPTTLTVNCEGTELLNAAKITGTLSLTKDDKGVMTAAGPLNFTLKRTGLSSNPVDILNVQVSGILQEISEPDVNGVMGAPLRLLNLGLIGHDIQFVKLSFDVPSFSSWVRTTDSVKYYTACLH